MSLGQLHVFKIFHVLHRKLLSRRIPSDALFWSLSSIRGTVLLNTAFQSEQVNPSVEAASPGTVEDTKSYSVLVSIPRGTPLNLPTFWIASGDNIGAVNTSKIVKFLWKRSPILSIINAIRCQVSTSCSVSFQEILQSTFDPSLVIPATATNCQTIFFKSKTSVFCKTKWGRCSVGKYTAFRNEETVPKHQTCPTHLQGTIRAVIAKLLAMQCPNLLAK